MKIFKYTLLVLLVFGSIADLLSVDQTASTTKNTPCTTMNTKYQIIYLNGPSSSGKTTLAHLLQQELDPPFLHIGIDRVIGMMPDKLNNWEGGPAPLGFSWKNSIVQNMRSRAVMERIGMHHNSQDDFDHPKLPEGHKLRRHVLYRLGAQKWQNQNNTN